MATPLARTRKDGFYAPDAENDTGCVTCDEKICRKVVDGDCASEQSHRWRRRLQKEKRAHSDILYARMFRLPFELA
jgi:hypothetical protein